MAWCASSVQIVHPGAKTKQDVKRVAPRKKNYWVVIGNLIDRFDARPNAVVHLPDFDCNNQRSRDARCWR